MNRGWVNHFISRPIKGLCLYVIWVLAGAGCTTMTSYEESHQPVLFQSNPPGAKIMKGDKVLGETPSYIFLKRQRSQKLRLVYGDEEKRVRLKSFYRWEESFFSNLVFFPVYPVIPIAWGVDLFTQTAYAYRELPVFEFNKRAARENRDGVTTVAIAPPQIYDVKLSQEVAQKVAEKIKEGGQSLEVLKFSKTTPTFLDFDYSNEYRPSKKQRDAIYARLDNDWVVETTVEDKGRYYEFESRAYNVFTQGLKKRFIGRVSKESFKITKDRRWTKSLGELFEWVPNTFRFDLASSTPSFKVSGEEQEGENVAEEGLLAFLASFGVTTSDPPTSYPGWRYRFKFIPAFYLNFSEMEYPDVPELTDEKYKRLNISLGYGPQFSWHSKWGIINFDVLPVLSWSQIKYSENFTGREEKLSGADGAAVFELGYSYFLSESLVVKLFARRVSESSKLWREAFAQSSGSDLEVSETGYSYGGLSFGYYFPPEEHPLKALYD